VAGVAAHKHHFVAAGGNVYDTSSLTKAQFDLLLAAEQRGELFCPTCKGRMRLVVDHGGVHATHLAPNPFAGHEPEDYTLRRVKHAMARHLQRLFPSAPLDLDVHLPEIGHLADIVVVTPHGGRLAVEVQRADISADEISSLRERYASLAIGCLWVLDPRRGKMTRGKGPIRRVMLDRLETALLAAGEPLVVCDPAATRQVMWIRPHPQARELAALGEEKIGRVDCLVRQYSLSQLRVNEGKWHVPSAKYDPAPPPYPPLPAPVQRKLDRRRAAAT
jgi:hypothetical protein